MRVTKTIEKLEGHSESLLTFYLGAARTYSLLDPMIFDKDVCGDRGSKHAASGFSIIRSSLYFGVIQDIANIVFDRGKSNPSIINITEAIKSDAILNALRENYVSEYCGDSESENFYRKRAKDRIKIFDERLEELFRLTEEVLNSSEFQAAKSVRDEFSAHKDIKYVGGSYQYPDIKKYGLKWGSPKNMLSYLRPLISHIGFIVRDSDFAWEAFELQNARIASGFWGSSGANKSRQENAKKTGSSS